MADYQYITALGVIVPDTANILADVQSEWLEAFGADLIIDSETPQGVMIAAEAESRDAVARNNAALANQINPDQSGGIFLDGIWALTRGSRRGATRSLISGATLGGQSGTIITAGSLATVAATSAVFQTVDTVIIGAGGTVTVNFESVEFGAIECGIGDLSNVATSVLGWETVTNPSAAALGRLQESDIASRRRRRLTLALQGSRTSEAVISRIMDIDDVRSMVFRENVAGATVVIDGVSMVEHSIFCCVDGGSNADVAWAILDSKSTGSNMVGTTTVAVVDPSSNQSYDVKFQRPAEINAFIRVTARFNGTDGTTIIPAAIEAYVNGELDGETGFGVGDDVSPFEIAGAINQVEPRIFTTLVELSTDGITYSVADIAISIQQVARLATVTVIPA